jgi:nitroreductase
MNTLEAISARRAVRSYDETPIERQTLGLLIAAASQAPSGLNAQPWHFTVIRNQARLDQLSSAAKTHMRQVLGDDEGAPAIRRMVVEPDFQIFYHAPALILISVKIGDWAVEDASLAAENLMLAAVEQGLGTCWIGVAQRWLETDEGKRSIALPPEFLPVAPIIVGHPRGATPPVPRTAPVVSWID